MNREVIQEQAEEYKKLCQYTMNIDRTIKKIEKKNKHDIRTMQNKLGKLFTTLEKEELLDDDLTLLSKITNSYYFDLDDLNQSVLSSIAFHIIKEKEETGSVRQKLFQVLQNVISKEEFSLFDSDENVDAMIKICQSLLMDEVEFLAVLRYLTSHEKMNSMIKKAVTKDGVSTVRKRLENFCYYLGKKDIKFYIYT